MLKKKISLIISAILIITSVGCSNKPKDKVDDSQKPVVEESVDKKEDKPEDKDESKDKNTSTETEKPKEPTDTTKPTVTQPEAPKPETPKPQQPKPETPKPPAPKPEEKPAPKPETKPEIKPEEKAVATKDIADKLKEGLDLPSTMALDEERAKEAYGLDTNLLSEYTIYVAMMNVKSDEIAIFKVKDSKDIAKVKESIAKRQEQLTKTWQQYLPDQYEKVQNHIIIEKGNYVMYCISDNQEKAEEIFNSFFKK